MPSPAPRSESGFGHVALVQLEARLPRGRSPCRGRAPGSAPRGPRSASSWASRPPTAPVAPVTSARMSVAYGAAGRVAITWHASAPMPAIPRLRSCSRRSPSAPRRGEPPPRRAAVRLDPIGRFTNPVHVAAPPGDRERVFVVERPGRIRIVRDGRTNDRPFLDIRSRVALLRRAGPAVDGVRARLRGRRAASTSSSPSAPAATCACSSTARPTTPTSPTRTPPARSCACRTAASANHNGGQLAFGPDGLLYISTGDGGGARRPAAQRPEPPLAARQDPAHRRRPAAARGRRVYAYGLRNPFRFSFDRSTGDLAIGDVGQDAIEEIDFMRRGTRAGANFGWSVFEGTRRYPLAAACAATAGPVIQHSHRRGLVLDHRRLRRARPRRTTCTAATSTATSARATCTPRGSAAAARAACGASACACRTCRRSARTREGRVYAASLGGTVYRLR